MNTLILIPWKYLKFQARIIEPGPVVEGLVRGKWRGFRVLIIRKQNWLIASLEIILLSME